MIKTLNLFPKGAVNIPPSKSLTHRALICYALAHGGEVINPSASEDIAATRRCLDALFSGGEALDCGESGSTLRFLLPLAAALGSTALFTGRGRLLDRPMGPFESILGLRRESGGLSTGTVLKSGSFTLPGNISSQFISGLLMALPLIGGGEIIVEGALESASYVELTLDVMRDFGAETERNGCARFTVPPESKYRPAVYTVEGDYSQAAFFLVAAALGRDVECLGLREDSKQGDRVILDILQRCGAKLIPGAGGGLTVRAERLAAFSQDMGDCPDLAPPLCALAAFCEGESRLFNASRLRHKESDRLEAPARQLSRLGADIRASGDEIIINGRESLPGGSADAEGDHRIAMMLATASIGCRGAVAISGAEAVNKSYPGFWEDFERSPL